jgi:acetyl-CoA carboxylase biotin carboxylase subunit
MFSKILVANRGEIAARIIKTCQKLGVSTVAVYSEADRDAMHTRMADQAVCIGPPAATESYLNIDAIMDACRSTGAEAIHPGYGFLSENNELAQRCKTDGVVFIGPGEEVLNQMGDKLSARRVARKSGLPVMPGTEEPVSDDEAITRAWELGFPMMVKAAAGGGGIGIHVVHSMAELEPVIERTRKIAQAAFADSSLFYERYLEGASHIEVQIIGDQYGNVLHLFERDCSIQRRNQKLIEETPASAKLPADVREQLGRLSRQLAREAGYTNAGTVEFLIASDGHFYFMEMNPRLQVEHGVTELITGQDIVDLQLQSAAGIPFAIRQRDLRPNGHAIEARIYPEDPDTLLPNVGTVTELQLPEGHNVRVDTALCVGYEVSLHYEPLLAKVMAWGYDRDDAIATLDQALADFHLTGVTTNIPLLRDVLVSPEFTSGQYHTGSLNGILERRLQAKGKSTTVHPNGASANGHQPAGALDPRALAAAIGAAAVAAQQANGQGGGARESASRWRMQGRRDLFRSRLGSASW